MSLDFLWLAAPFAVGMLFTPGPNNIMLTNSGATFGLARTAPHIVGVAWGFAAMVFCVALGFSAVLLEFPQIKGVLRWVGAAVMLWIAYKVATAGRAGDKRAAKPFTFAQACAFQLINPKGWTMAVAVATGYLPGINPTVEAFAIAMLFGVLGTASAVTWASVGMAIRRFLSTDRALRVFNGIMGALIVGCVIWMLLR